MTGNSDGAKVLQVAERLVKRPLIEERGEIDFSGGAVDEYNAETMPLQWDGLAEFSWR
jgi:hypothetical protein